MRPALGVVVKWVEMTGSVSLRSLLFALLICCIFLSSWITAFLGVGAYGSEGGGGCVSRGVGGSVSAWVVRGCLIVGGCAWLWGCLRGDLKMNRPSHYTHTHRGI